MTNNCDKKWIESNDVKRKSIGRKGEKIIGQVESARDVGRGRNKFKRSSKVSSEMKT